MATACGAHRAATGRSSQTPEGVDSSAAQVCAGGRLVRLFGAGGNSSILRDPGPSTILGIEQSGRVAELADAQDLGTSKTLQRNHLQMLEISAIF